ncbi:hypothetical protein TNCV_2949431 [Trichonephila clavipes]|nr:hypothetical protein TNCV_2949431 [Trichonephila clavipes]
MAGFVTSSSPVPLKIHRVGQRFTLNLSRAETFSHGCGVVVRRGTAEEQDIKGAETDGVAAEHEITEGLLGERWLERMRDKGSERVRRKTGFKGDIGKPLQREN